MTIHNQLSYAAELQNGIASAAGMGRDGEGVIRLGETLDPILDVWRLPEWAYLRGERLGAGAAFVGALAGEFGIAELGNAAGSGMLVVVEGVSFTSGAGVSAALEVVDDATMAATLSAQAFFVSGRDRRWGSTTGRTFLRTGTDAANTFGVKLEQRENVSGGNFADFQSVPIVLKPGDAIIVIALTANNTMTVNFKWRERKAFSGELTGA